MSKLFRLLFAQSLIKQTKGLFVCKLNIKESCSVFFSRRPLNVFTVNFCLNCLDCYSAINVGGSISLIKAN